MKFAAVCADDEIRAVDLVRVIVYGLDPARLTAVAGEYYRRGHRTRIVWGERLPEAPERLLWIAAEPYPLWRARWGADWREIVREYFAYCCAAANFSDPWERLWVIKAVQKSGATKGDFERYMKHLIAMKRVKPRRRYVPKRKSKGRGSDD